jgi:AraC family transcriptional regulator
VVGGTIPAGRCALLRYAGNEHSFGTALSYRHGVWLPRSGEEARDFPLYCQRVTFFRDVPKCQAITDIFLPLS